MEPLGELVPDVGRVGVLEQLLALAGDRAQPVPQVVLDVRDEVVDPVVERGLPPGGALLERVDAGLGLLQLVGQVLGARRVLLAEQLRAHRRGQRTADGQHVLADRRTVQVVGTGDDLAQQEADQLLEAGLGDQVHVLGAGGVQPQGRGDRVDRRVDPGARQVALVELDDPPPVRVQVGLRHHAADVRAQLHRRRQELQLGGGVLLRRVGHQHDGVRGRERGHRRGAVRRTEATDPGRVHQHQPGREQLARERHLGAGQPGLVARVAGLGHVVRELFDRHLRRLGALMLGAGLAYERHARLRAVFHQRRDGGGDVVVDRADRRVDQRVDELALALLELADDQDADVRVGETGAGGVQPLGEIGPFVGGGRLERQVDELDRLRYRHDSTPPPSCRSRHRLPEPWRRLVVTRERTVPFTPGG